MMMTMGRLFRIPTWLEGQCILDRRYRICRILSLREVR